MNKNSSHKIRVAILGAGGISSEHAETLNWLPNTKIVAVCDLFQKRAQELSEKYKIPEVFTSLDEMLEKTRPDVVHVLSQPDAHVKLATQCLKAGSNVFVEKPVGITVAECRELMDVAKSKNLVVGTNHNYLYRPVVQRLIDQIRSRRFGRLEHVNIAWSMAPSKVLNVSPNHYLLRAPQNPLFEWAVHPLAIVHRLLGKVKRIEALAGGEVITSTGGKFNSSWQASMECERGTAQLLISTGYRQIWMDVLGEDAFSFVDLTNDSMIISEYMPYRPLIAGFRDACSKVTDIFRDTVRYTRNYVMSGLGRSFYPASPHQAGMRNSMSAFYTAISSGLTPPEGVEQGAAVVEYCERIFKSAFSTMQKEVVNGKE